METSLDNLWKCKFAIFISKLFLNMVYFRYIFACVEHFPQARDKTLYHYLHVQKEHFLCFIKILLIPF